ncbi:DUF1707 domain-containing protein [Nonomuraea fuscirosea]|uniref:DUF1707 SHOCT-like domain-containing protein n=1 Tax=Nonomuraea fuscirosea TaxID=1291556 RepID=UPI0037125034
MDSSELRIGDAEREQTMAALREHFAQGRLTHEELDERLDRSLAAKTAGDLAQVTADLPGHQPAYREQAAPYETPGSPYGAGDWRAAMHAHRQQMRAVHDTHREMHRAAWQARREMRWRGPMRGPMQGPMRRGHGPHPLVPVLFVLMVLGLIFGGFGVFKALLVVWLGALLFSLVRRRFHHRG